MSKTVGKPAKKDVAQTKAILKKIEVPGSGSDKKAAKNMPMPKKTPGKGVSAVKDRMVKKVGRGR